MSKSGAGLCTVIPIEQFTVSIVVSTPVLSDPCPKWKLYMDCQTLEEMNIIRLPGMFANI